MDKVISCLKIWISKKGSIAEIKFNLPVSRSRGCLATYFHSSKKKLSINERSRRFQAVSEFAAVPVCECYPSPNFQNLLSRVMLPSNLNWKHLQDAAIHFCPLEYHLFLIEQFLQEIHETCDKENRMRDGSASDNSTTKDAEIKLNRNTTMQRLPLTIKNAISLTDLLQIVQSIAKKYVASNWLPYLDDINFKEILHAWQLKNTDFSRKSASAKSLPLENSGSSQKFLSIFGSAHQGRVEPAGNVSDDVKCLDVVQLECFLSAIRKELHNYLIPNWKYNRYFDRITYKSDFFGRRYSTEAIGLSIGTPSALFLQNSARLYQQANLENKFPFQSIPVNEELDGKINRVLGEAQNTSNPASDENLNAEVGIAGLDMLPNSSLSRSGFHFSTLQGIRESLEKYGMVIIRKGHTLSEIKKLQAGLHTINRTGKEMAEQLMSDDGNIHCHKPTLGRIHCLMRGTTLETYALKIQHLWMPILYSYLVTERFSKSVADNFKLIIHNSNGDISKISLPDEIKSGALSILSESNKTAKTVPGFPRLFLSSIEAVAADSLAISQSWHRETKRRGLTVFIPLAKISAEAENGCIEVLPGTHILRPENEPTLSTRISHLLRFFRCFEETNGPYSVNLDLGDVLICDSRLLHRALSNETWLTTPMLIMRYDYEEERFPGISLVDNRLARIVGKLATVVQKLYYSV
ncbi:Phytanoyl-CoA dioxygenase (PhyH) superfamily protein [Cardiosporidium cionae]|uniref:Phytanoyl-CoA dioxygenase (PhyH) superfamily protein n=1 Tax=Cardiosporidium cionae TaxID=476202 RepID=A0ABQ7JFC4_9APIC|nr:Phytanoyl-CoA dioxygenase (PhyH) superfamily protein [Cardiosporidium cionae]|eukprot:KAF8822710.1 Phytanoyl-CoA dioxygenase (PhyH) superfamily protein [Cardiosporidium cionae]